MYSTLRRIILVKNLMAVTFLAHHIPW